MTIAVYPGTFDPLTIGHDDIIKRASRLFDKVIVAVAESTNKQPLFSLEQRVQLATQVLASYQSVEVKGFSSLLIDFCKQHNATTILRGLRVVSDFDYELQLAEMNRSLAPEIDTVFLTPFAKNTHISSSLVREVASYGGDVTAFVDAHVVKALQQLANNKV